MRHHYISIRVTKSGVSKKVGKLNHSDIAGGNAKSVGFQSTFFLFSYVEKWFKCMVQYVEQKHLRIRQVHFRLLEIPPHQLTQTYFPFSPAIDSTCVLMFYPFCGILRNRSFSFYFSQICQSSFLVCPSIVSRIPLTLESIYSPVFPIKVLKLCFSHVSPSLI